MTEPMIPRVLKRYVETAVSELLGYGWNEELMNDAFKELLEDTYEDNKFNVHIDVEDDIMFITVDVCESTTGERFYTQKYRLTLSEEV